MQYQQLRTLPSFDVLQKLARQDPRALEDLRRRLTNDVIRRGRSQRSRQRLRGLQFTIDLERKRARDPLAACVKLSQMMHESLAELNRAFLDPEPPRAAAFPEPATVVPFKRNGHHV